MTASFVGRGMDGLKKVSRRAVRGVKWRVGNRVIAAMLGREWV